MIYKEIDDSFCLEDGKIDHHPDWKNVLTRFGILRDAGENLQENL